MSHDRGGALIVATGVLCIAACSGNADLSPNSPQPLPAAAPTPAPTAPAITLRPASQTVATGQSASFTVGAFGSEPLSYQWARDGAPIAGRSFPRICLGVNALPGGRGERCGHVGILHVCAAKLTPCLPAPGAVDHRPFGQPGLPCAMTLVYSWRTARRGTLPAMIYRQRYIGGLLVKWAVAGPVIFLDVDWLRVVRRCQPR